jgi:hypothetical protein
VLLFVLVFVKVVKFRKRGETLRIATTDKLLQGLKRPKTGTQQAPGIGQGDTEMEHSLVVRCGPV